MKNSLVKIDRTTAQEWLPMLINKGLFNRFNDLPTRQEILDNAKRELGVEKLTPSQERQALAAVGEYKTSNWVVRDYGSYSIGFDIKMHYESLLDAEKKFEDELTMDRYEREQIEQTLARIRLYKLGHRLAMVILSEAYRQRKYEELTITKQTILSYLGYNAEEKHIYQDIDDAMFSLRWLNYVVHEYKNKAADKLKSLQTGNFIYNLRQDSKSYTVWINKAFLGCIEHVLQKETENLSTDEKKLVFSRGYFTYDTKLLSMTRNYSTTAYLLAHFLVLDSGNNKLNYDECKVVAYKASRFMAEAKIANVRPGKRKNDLIRALQEVDIIAQITPDLSELKKIKPSMFDDTPIRVHIKK